jgi:hypothetical protein
MAATSMSVSALLAEANQAVRARLGRVELIAEVASVRDPADSRNPAASARYLNLTLTDADSGRAPAKGLAASYRLPQERAAALRALIQPGVRVRVEGRLQVARYGKRWSNELEIVLTAIEAQGEALTRAAYDQAAARCAQEFTARPPLPRLIHRVTVFMVQGTSREDVQQWNTDLIPRMTTVPIPGDGPELIATVREQVPNVITDRPDLAPMFHLTWGWRCWLRR